MSKTPIVKIDLLEGRTSEQKKRLAEAVTDDLVRVLGVDRNNVIVIFNDLPKENLVKGGTPATEWKK
ncbi:4-oxalocrotonate tautomerase family protein [Candidatus Bathyarchaeota archaeon]|nr:4-oxalocrotonate tautomerase family protein [Candidatus Bathyarchaeota archaeon]